MKFPRALILGGVVLLVAACNAGVTSVKEVDGGAASSAKAPGNSADAKKKGPNSPGQQFNAQSDSTGGCPRGSLPVVIGFSDTVCVEQ